MSADRTGRVRIWDWPTRITHWLLAALVPILWWTAEEHLIAQHMLAGQLVLGLLLFRLIWGFIGSSTARFSGFLRGPAAIRDYLAGRGERRVGHNPLGALSVVAMLALLATQVGLGLFAVDEDGLNQGPLAHLVSYEAAEQLTELHELNFWILVAFIALHVGAILFYLIVRRDNLVGPMLSGSGAMPPGTAPMRPAGLPRFLIAALGAAGAVYMIVTAA